MIGQAVFEHLRADSALMKLCRWIYPQVIPQDREPPAITYSVQQIERSRSLSGEEPYTLAQIAIDCYSEREIESQAIGDAVEAALVDYRGTLGKAASGIDCDHCRLDRRFDIFEQRTELHRVALQFTFGYEGTL